MTSADIPPGGEGYFPKYRLLQKDLIEVKDYLAQ
jgi:hypothetical protein